MPVEFFDWRNIMNLKISLLLSSVLGLIILIQSLIRAIWLNSIGILLIAIALIFVTVYISTTILLKPYQKLIAQLQQFDTSILKRGTNNFQDYTAINNRITRAFKNVYKSRKEQIMTNQSLLDHQRLEEYLLQDIKDSSEQIYVVFQPKVNLSTGGNVGVEALVRWENSKVGVVSPSEFIPIAESSGLIHSLWKKVMIEVCLQINKWKELYGEEVTVAVNFSPVQFQNKNLVSQVNQILEAHSVPNKLIEIEVTENADLTDEAIITLNQFSSAGFRIALDDFGKGFSSLSYMFDVPLDFLKLDRSFIDAIDKKENGRELIKNIITMAHNLKIKVVAEGVEELVQLEYLRECKCDIAQGYFFDRPLSSSEFEDKWLKARGVEMDEII
jgi:EAL domain-containing protein (putative c-di-GMP-specific phosphodiesterase class I)